MFLSSSFTYNYLVVFALMVGQKCNRFASICRQTGGLIERFIQIELEPVIFVSSEISHQHFRKITNDKDLDVIC